MKIDANLQIDSPLDHPEAIRIKDCVNTVLNGDAFGAMIISDGGLGKTRGIRQMLENWGTEGKEWIHIQSNVTDTRLYASLFEHNDKLIFFDDLGDAAKTKAGITVLKQATETIDGTNRFVSWNSPSTMLSNTPPRFEFKGRIIFCLNQLSDENDPDIFALKTRFRSCTFSPSNKTILEMMLPIYKKIGNDMRIPDEKCRMIFDHLCEITTEDSFNVNIRLLSTALSFYKCHQQRWKRYLAEDIGRGREDLIIIDIVNNLKLRGEPAHDMWRKRTNKSKSSFHIRLKKLREMYAI